MYRLRPLNLDIHTATFNAWSEFLIDLEEEYSTWGYFAALSYASELMGREIPEARVYALTSMEDDVAVALTTFTHKLGQLRQLHPESAIKVLQIRTHPQYDTRNPEKEGDSRTQRRRRLMPVLSHLLTELVGLSYQEFPAAKVKVLVNKQVDFDFFAHLEEKLVEDEDETALDFQFASHGNWFEIIKR